MFTTIRNSDQEILRYCHELRFCTIDHLAALTGRRRQALNLRLNQLIAEKYIHRYRFPNPNHKHIYSIGSQGYRHLAFNGAIRPQDVPARLRTAELKPLFLDHTLLISNIHAALILASQVTPNRLADWREGKQLYESVTFYEDGRKIRLPVCPDAFFQINCSAQFETRFAFALEADRGTTTHRTFGNKLKAYEHFLKQNRQLGAYGVPWFRVVTITLTQKRADHLANLAGHSVPVPFKKYFLFASWESFTLESPEMLYTPIFSTTKIAARRGLVK